MTTKLGWFLGPSQRRDKLEIGSQLFERVLRDNSKLFISEDIGQLKSAFQNETQFAKDAEAIDQNRSPLFDNLHFILVAILAIIIASLWFVVNYLLILLLIIILGLIVATILFIYYQRYQETQFDDNFQLVINEFKKEKEFYKKLMQLIEDNIVFVDSNENQEKRVETLKIAFRDIGLKSFLHFRECTNLLVNRFPMKSDIDDNLICSLPDDSFESYKNNEELTLKALKSLKQLVRLQISELLKRFFFLFIRNYFENQSDFETNYFSYLQTKVFSHILTESRLRQKELLSVLYYHRSFYDQDSVVQDRVHFNTSESSNLWLICRNIRKNLYSSLSIVDKFETMLQTSEELSAEHKEIFETKLEALNGEIATMQEFVQSINKIIKMKDLKAASSQATNIEAQNLAEETECTSALKPSVEEYVAKDEVFEAYVPQRVDEEFDNNNLGSIESENLVKEAEASGNVFRELKHALKRKAIEHKVREAKVLGLEVDVEKLEKEYVATVIEKIDDKERTRVFVDPTKKENTVPSQCETPANYNFAFNLDIAMKATEKMRLLLDVNEDTFECDSPVESNQSGDDYEDDDEDEKRD